MDQSLIEQANEYPVLGPHYFAARKVAEEFMAKFEPEHFKQLIESFAKEFEDKVWGDICDHLLSDTESNLQNTIWRQIDDSVQALLTGQKWAIDRYVLGDRYDHSGIRAKLAALIPDELQTARLKDVEAENESLREDLRRERERYR